jgi:hypothetical protein
MEINTVKKEGNTFPVKSHTMLRVLHYSDRS